MTRARRPVPRLAAALVPALALATAGCSTLPGWMVVQGKSSIDDHRHFDNAPIARAAQPLPLPSEPAALRWPGGLDDAAAERLLADNGTVALLVVRRGTLVHERYFGGFGPDSVGTSFSAAKSVVSAMVGIAIGEGRIAGIDEPLTRFLPELLRNDPRFGRITLRHLLTMRSGIAFREDYRNPLGEAARFYLTPDLRREVAGLAIADPPDQAYRYSSGDTQLLAMAVERAAAMPFARYVQERLWQPMGAEADASWSLDSHAGGTVRGFCCLNARARDFARFGLLFLNAGRAGGAQVVPADWVRDSTAAQDGLPGATDEQRRNIERLTGGRTAFYAWQWRRLPAAAPAGAPLQPGGSFFAQGLWGQYIVVVPEADTVVVRLGRHPGQVRWAAWLDALARANAPGP